MRRRLSAALISCVVCITAVGVISFAWATESSKAKTYTGKVGDALCGVQHSMPVSALECIRQCLGKGSRYSLIVGDKVYALDTENQAVLDVLDKLADTQVKVTGTESEDGKIIVVKSVKASASNK